MANPAPGRLELVREFVNTWDEEQQTEALAEPAALAAWLADRDLLAADARVKAPELEQALELREALRALLFANAGLELDPEAPAVLDQAAGRAGVRLRFAPDATPTLRPDAAGVDAALGELLAIVAAAMDEGTWSRLKVCMADDCRWAYYDQSRNRSSVWCNMAVCGNRQKVRSFRARHLRAGAG